MAGPGLTADPMTFRSRQTTALPALARISARIRLIPSQGRRRRERPSLRGNRVQPGRPVTGQSRGALSLFAFMPSFRCRRRRVTWTCRAARREAL